MKGRILLLTAAVSSLLLAAFVIPLALLVQHYSEESALGRAEARTQYLGGLAAQGPRAELSRVVATVQGDGIDISVIFPDNTVIGAPITVDAPIELARTGRSFTAETPGGKEVLFAVEQSRGSVIVVRGFVPDSQLSAGVGQTWLFLGLLSLVLFGVGLVLAYLLTLTLLRPLRTLMEASARIGEGDLAARVRPSGPAEIKDLGNRQNQLAERVGELLNVERERVADLSHRVRTPLTSLRLAVDSVRDGDTAATLNERIDELEDAVNRTIREARLRASAASVSTDAIAALAERVAFWEPLATDTERTITVTSQVAQARVSLAPSDFEALLDAIIQNFFAHTPDGSFLAVTAGIQEDALVLTAEDNGPGFSDLARITERGESGAGSTGLGLDIVVRTAERGGGTVQFGLSDSGGAKIVVRLKVTT